MGMRTSLEGLKSLTETAASSPAGSPSQETSATSGSSALGSDSATVSSAGSEISQVAADSDVRVDKVTGIQAELTAGSYDVPASAVASKVVDSMLNDH